MNTYKHKGKQPQGIRKEGGLRRKSPRLQQGATHQLFQSALCVPENISPNSPLQSSTTVPPRSHKRKRSHEIHVSDGQTKKQRFNYTVGDAHTETADDKERILEYWSTHQEWPKDLFEQASAMNNQLARAKSTSTLRHESSASSINASEKVSPDNSSKSSIYIDNRFESIINSHGSFLMKDKEGPKGQSLCNELLDAEQPVPRDSLFRDDLFEDTCNYLSSRSEAMVIRDIGQLIVPGATTLARMGAKHLDILAETVNECWSESIPLFKPRPQPDYSVGFSRSAFSQALLQRLQPFIGTVWQKSYYAATWYLYFPFLVCEVKSGTAPLDIADRQNAHSATLAVHAVVGLFRSVRREREVNREILAFSVSHNHSNSCIYGHYPVIDGSDTKYYRYAINKSDFTIMSGRDRWATYRFTRNVYDIWMPRHLERLCSAIKDLPVVLQESQPSFNQAALSQQSESESGSSLAATEATTPDTFVSQSFKKPRVRR